MVRFHRSARAAADTTFPEVVQWAKEVADYVTSNYPEATILAFAEQYGAVGTIHWYADYEDIATLDQVGSQLLTAEGYWAVIATGTGLFIEGSAHDTVMASV